jgi:hypothetical protein
VLHRTVLQDSDHDKTQGTDTSLSLLIPLAAADATAPLVKIMRLRFCTCNRDGQDARSLDG